MNWAKLTEKVYFEKLQPLRGNKLKYDILELLSFNYQIKVFEFVLTFFLGEQETCEWSIVHHRTK